MEVELKLNIAKQDIVKFKQHSLLHTKTVRGPISSHIITTYFDTLQHNLHAMGMALRLRTVGNQVIQTFKMNGKVTDGLHQRQEWEGVTGNGQLDFQLIPEQATREKVLPYAPHLIPLFQTVMQRDTWVLQYQGTSVEVALDEGYVKIGEQRLIFHEVELELKQGDCEKLREIGEIFRQTIALTEESHSKAERGYQYLLHAD
jgi:triphosphatase